jgi:hypothetical protein
LYQAYVHRRPAHGPEYYNLVCDQLDHCLLSLLAEGLLTFRGINSIEPYSCIYCTVISLYSITINNSTTFAEKVLAIEVSGVVKRKTASGKMAN